MNIQEIRCFGSSLVPHLYAQYVSFHIIHVFNIEYSFSFNETVYIWSVFLIKGNRANSR